MPPQSAERRLAAILFTDLVGSTGPMARSEEAGLRAKRRHREIVREQVQRFQGDFVEAPGDETLSIFTSSLDAVSCALAIENEAGSDLPLHLGIHSADVLVEGGEIHGDGVNIASRLEGLAEPGGIYLSDDAYRQVRGKVEAEFEDLGEQELKNVAEPVRVYRVATAVSGTASAKPTSRPLSLPEKPSIAVLPFTNMSGDPEQEYFSDGITNDIVTMLSHIRRLRVVARHSTLAYKEYKPSIIDIAAKQGVRYILDGSVRNGGDRICVNVQLIDSQTGENCWAENYDRDLKDIFAVQDEITKNIAVEMQVHLLSGDSAREVSAGTKSVKAWELVSMAWDLQDSYIKDNMLEARRQVDKALQLDPEYSTAWVVLGWTHWQAANVGFSESIDDSIREARNAADKPLSIDSENAEALVLKGSCHVTSNEPGLAVETCCRAVEISPGNAEVQALTAYALVYAGEYDKALTHHEASLRLCPICPNWFQLVGGTIYQRTGDLDKAIARFRKGVEIEPESPLCRYHLIDALMDAGREKEARACADEIRELDSAFSISGMLLSHSHNKDIRERFRANLEKVGFEEYRA